MEQGQARVAQSGLGLPRCPTGQQQQGDEVSEWKETPWRGHRASTGLTHGSAKKIATILEHRGASRLAEPSSVGKEKGLQNKHMHACCYLLKYLKLVKVSAL